MSPAGRTRATRAGRFWPGLLVAAFSSEFDRTVRLRSRPGGGFFCGDRLRKLRKFAGQGEPQQTRPGGARTRGRTSHEKLRALCHRAAGRRPQRRPRLRGLAPAPRSWPRSLRRGLGPSGVRCSHAFGHRRVLCTSLPLLLAHHAASHRPRGLRACAQQRASPTGRGRPRRRPCCHSSNARLKAPGIDAIGCTPHWGRCARPPAPCGMLLQNLCRRPRPRSLALDPAPPAAQFKLC